MHKSPIDIPPQAVGDVWVEHEFYGDLKIHRLHSSKYGSWMSDTELDIKQMKEAVSAVEAKGKGLVGGLGLGLVIEFLGQRKSVKQIDVIDISQDTVDLIMPHLKAKDKCRVFVEDIYRFIQNLAEWNYDFAILDTWQGVGKETWLLQVMPLRRLIANKFGKQNIYNWTQDTMFKEMMQVLTTKKPYWILDKMPMPMTAKDANWFLINVGLPKWEEKYGDKVYDKFKSN